MSDKKSLLKKIIFLLRTACKELDTRANRILQNTKDISINPTYLFTKPKGKGWEAAVDFIYSKIALVEKEELDYILPLLKEWVGHKPKGDTARMCGLFALHFYKDSELNKNAYYSSETENMLLKIVLSVAVELKTELLSITEDLLSKPFNRQEPFDSLSFEFSFAKVFL